MTRVLGRRSIVSRLRLAIFVNALVPMLLVGLLLGFFAYFGQLGSQHAQRVGSEISVGQAGYDLVRASQALQDIQLGQTERVSELRSALRDASSELQIALETGRELYPAADLERLAQFERDVSTMREETARQSAQEVAENASALSQQLESCSTKSHPFSTICIVMRALSLTPCWTISSPLFWSVSHWPSSPVWHLTLVRGPQWRMSRAQYLR